MNEVIILPMTYIQVTSMRNIEDMNHFEHTGFINASLASLSAIMLAVQEGRDWRRWSSHLVAIGWMM
jgi:hypothetical protein